MKNKIIGMAILSITLSTMGIYEFKRMEAKRIVDDITTPEMLEQFNKNPNTFEDSLETEFPCNLRKKVINALLQPVELQLTQPYLINTVNKGDDHLLTNIAFSPDGKYLASESEIKTEHGDINKINLYNLETQKEDKNYKVSSNEALAFSPDGKKLAAVSYASEHMSTELIIWDLQTNDKQSYILTPESPYYLEGWIRSLAFLKDGNILAFGGQQGIIKLLNLETKETSELKVEQFQGEPNSIRSIAVNLANDQLAVGYKDGFVRIWDPHAKTIITTIHPAAYPVPVELNDILKSIQAVAFNNDGTLFALVNGFGTIKISSNAFIPIKTIETNNFIHSIAFNPKRAMIAADIDMKVIIWNPYTGKVLYNINPEGAVEIMSIAFSPDGKMIAIRANQWAGNSIVTLWGIPELAEIADSIDLEQALYIYYLLLEKETGKQYINPADKEAQEAFKQLHDSLPEKIKAIVEKSNTKNDEMESL